MAQEIADQSLAIPSDHSLPSASDDRRPPLDYACPTLTRALSSSRLNARAAEFVPRSSMQLPASSPLPIRQGVAPIAHPVAHVSHQVPPSPTYFDPWPSSFEYVGGGFAENEMGHAGVDIGPSSVDKDGLSEEVVQKITNQVEYYFSDVNLATTEHLMRFISKDPDGFVPISTVAAFKKIKALIHNIHQLAMALRTSSKLVVSDDGKKVRRQQPFTESDMEELQSRIVVAENLPEDHSYHNLMNIFSVVGRVKTIRTCYPQPANGTASVNNRPTKLEMLFGNRLHAFVVYETVEDAEKAVSELNDEKNWRSGLRVKLFPKLLTKHVQGRGRRGHEGDLNGDEDVSTSNQLNEKHIDDVSHPSDTSHDRENDENFSEKDGASRRGRGWGRGGRSRGRGLHHSSNRGGHTIGTPPSSQLIHSEREQPAACKLPPGPRMPDGTRGFTFGRGKSVALANTIAFGDS